MTIPISPKIWDLWSNPNPHLNLGLKVIEIDWNGLKSIEIVNRLTIGKALPTYILKRTYNKWSFLRCLWYEICYTYIGTISNMKWCYITTRIFFRELYHYQSNLPTIYGTKWSDVYSKSSSSRYADSVNADSLYA